MLRKFYLITGLAILGLYGWIAFTGWELGSPPRAKLPPDVRRSGGGYRSHYFWQSGYHGGK